MDAIRIEGLTKKYKGIVAVDHLDLKIEEGKLFALLGINGAGKTTLIKMLACLTQPNSGDAFLHNKSIMSNRQEVKDLISISPQETAIAPNLSVRENLDLMCGINRFSKQKTGQKIKETVSQFALAPVLDKRAGKLSGGWRRRLSIAMALISEPKILFLDEPTLGLDVVARSELWDTIKNLKNKMTIILTTHYMEEAEALSDQVGIMKAGKLLALGSVHDLKVLANTTDFEQAFITIVKGG
ncbi:ABC transporter ATP-binding protein [Streptococcus ferus]|uniref:Multidrug ABC transporter ATPase n=1 Tax=Streptococcus ferus TaxID=1345 RepID=A0A2X3VQ90_9STRE|nr:ABC transporter A family member [Streptococcus ferus]SQF39885.1 multidrug ABC transporter ATPase [Streptococcus ferus]